MKRARDTMTLRFAKEPEPVLSAVTGALLAGNPTATVLLGQRNPKQVQSAANASGRALSPDEAAWVRRIYRSG